MSKVPDRKKRRRKSSNRGIRSVLRAILCVGLLICVGLLGVSLSMGGQYLLVPAALIVGIVVFLGRESVVSRKAAHHWREKWPDVQSTEKEALSLL